jgi:hypothetical protein
MSRQRVSFGVLTFEPQITRCTPLRTAALDRFRATSITHIEGDCVCGMAMFERQTIRKNERTIG